MIKEPTIREILAASASAVRGAADKNADFVRGSDYEALLGPSAVIFSRQAARDTDLFNAVNFHTADGDDLTEMAKKRYGKDRILDSRGTGSATFTRPASGASDTIWAGTRISLVGAQPRMYRVLADTPAPSTAVSVVVPIEAVDIGAGVACEVLSGETLRLEDMLEDLTWSVTALSCGDGTVFEKADAFRARIRQERLDARVGQSKAIIQACKDAGAANVVLFRSDYAGDAYDSGLNVCYVGDLGYTGTPGLVKACTLALRKTRVAGDHLQVLPMAKADLVVDVDVYLYGSPVLFDITRLERLHGQAVLRYLNGSAGRFAFSLDGIRGAISRDTPEVQRVVLTTPSADGAVVSGPMKNFPDVLNRYVASNVTIRYNAA
jgi:hypothetical protein